MHVEVLRNAVSAWNADGTGSDRPERGSWIQLWEDMTGRNRGACAYAGCWRAAEDGGHVWMKMKGLCIVPICRQCNSVTNTDRMQQQDGQHSQLRAGITVVRLAPTPEMRHADRRIAVRVCAECECDISGRPRTHTLCLECWQGGRRVRVCAECECDISDRPRSHTLCLECWSS